MKTKRNLHRLTLFTLLLLLLLNACSLFQPAPDDERTDGWIDWDNKGGWSGYASSDGVSLEEGAPSLALGAAPPEPPIAVDAEKSMDSPERPDQYGPMRAGSVDDNAEWDDYLIYRLRFSESGLPVHDLDVTERHTIRVTDADGRPILGAVVTISDANGRELSRLQTTSDGRALFFPNAIDGADVQSYFILAEKDGQEAALEIDGETRQHNLTLDAHTATDPIRLDVLFLIDATGSMSDEIQQLKDNMISVSERIHALPSAPNVRFGMTIYRDRDDLFVSRTFDFTTDIQAFTDELADVVAEGGGDYPESLNEGLHNALQLPEWRVEETVSLIFLIADAPPHLDYSQDFDYAQEIFTAAENGIKIFPLASSGLDDQGEYIFRQLAQVTGGKFLFLTYGAGGGPGDDTTHHVDDYSVLSLDDLVVKMVEEELQPLSYSQ
ncbi:MAG: VWA domain-containing protein [Anaerolineales bacterium]|nr:VWA domain-containing protein [Anaerolineales bacterium]